MPRPKLPIAGGPRSPEPPPWGGLGEEGWARGTTFLEFVDSAGEHRAEIEAAFHGVELPPEVAVFFESYPRPVRILALAGHASLESRLQVAQAERLFTRGRRLWMRIFAPERHPDLVPRFAGEGAELPRFVFFGDDRREFARWGPRPQSLQLHDVPELDREARVRAFHSQTHGVELAREFLALLSAHLGPETKKT